MTKASPSAAGSSASPSDVGNTVSAADSSVKSEKKKKSLLPKIFSSKRGARASDDESSESEFDKNVTARRKAFFEASPVIRKSFSERQTNSRIEGLDLSNYTPFMAQSIEYQDYRMFVGTWNVGGRAPNSDINLDDFLHVEGDSDIYVLGFQEIVPLNAGNVLVIEDNEPAAKWLALINLALNRPQHDSAYLFSDSSPSVKLSKDSKSNFFHKPNLKLLSKNLRVDSSLVKICNCSLESPILGGRRPRRFHDSPLEIHYGSSVKEFISLALDTNSQPNYCLISSKQMVGIFLTVWARKELVPHIGHLGASSIGRGIMGRLGNKGCISISMTLHKTSFCFVCSHLASGEKEGDELKRNADVAEILKSTQFPKICKNPHRLTPTKIIDHDRVIWLGDLNYRMSLSYEETKALMEYSDWGSLLKKDQLNIEREAGRVFTGWKEGQIIFAPTYKYTQNSDLYAGETVKSKKKRRTPAWCDRILWHGNGIDQVSYIRGESRFSDHRPVCAVFSVEVEVRTKNTKFRKGYSCAGTRISAYDNYIPQRHSFYEF